jgi:hypothetical protein
MAPKKAEEPEKKPLIGRVGTNLKVGIVGVPVRKIILFLVIKINKNSCKNLIST